MSAFEEEKKSLGRGLEDISKTFLSTNEQTKNKNMSHEFSSGVIREDRCSSCTHIVEDHSGHPKCRIFTFGSEEYGVRHLDSITPSHAKHCEYFEFKLPKNKDTTLGNEADYLHQAGVHCEVEEIVSVNKKSAFQDPENAQQKIRSVLTKHLEEGYSIRLIELTKNDEIVNIFHYQSTKS